MKKLLFRLNVSILFASEQTCSTYKGILNLCTGGGHSHAHDHHFHSEDSHSHSHSHAHSLEDLSIGLSILSKYFWSLICSFHYDPLGRPPCYHFCVHNCFQLIVIPFFSDNHVQFFWFGSYCLTVSIVHEFD